jgi:hypothetical protein
MGRNRHSHTLLVGRKNGAAIVEAVWQFLICQIGLAHGSASLVLGTYSENYKLVCT